MALESDMAWPDDIPIEYRNTIVIGDAMELTQRIPDSSIDLIFTDPPYPHEFLPLYSWLSREAARILKPGSLCLAYVGKTALPDVVSRLSEHLDYFWLFDIYEPGANVSLWKWKIWGNHRPILAFSNGKHNSNRWLHDAIVGGGRDKRFHAWGQNLSAMSYYIYSLTSANDIVFDPFVGGGTTAVACKAIGRNFIAFEKDPDVGSIAQDRLLKTQHPLLICPDVDCVQLSMDFANDD